MVNEMIKKQRFSIRKFKTGVGSVLLATVIFGVPMFTDQTQMTSSIVFADTIDKSSLKQSGWTREDAALITQYYQQKGANGLTQKRVEDLIDWYNGSAQIKTLIPNYSINYSYFNDVLKGDMANPKSFTDTFINGVISAYSTRAVDSFKTEIDKKIDELKKSPNADKYSNIINQLEDVKNGITADKITNDSAGLAKKLNDLISEEALNNAVNNDSSKTAAEVAKFKSDNAEVLTKTPETVTVADKTAVEKALNEYNGLSPEAQAKLTDEKANLDALKAKIAEQEAQEAQDAEVAKFKSDNADALAKTPETVTISDKDAVAKALADYAKLSPASQAKLTDEKANLDKLQAKIAEQDAAGVPS